jgi:hypothetical protein
LAFLLPFAEGPFVVFVDLAAVANVPDSIPFIDNDPSSKSGSDILESPSMISGNNDIIERLWALVATPRIDVRRRRNCMVGSV